MGELYSKLGPSCWNKLWEGLFHRARGSQMRQEVGNIR